jgi:hypothetical protein
MVWRVIELISALATRLSNVQTANIAPVNFLIPYLSVLLPEFILGQIALPMPGSCYS